jgi:uncharacterized membrane protein YhaH (DUF805 family)
MATLQPKYSAEGIMLGQFFGFEGRIGRGTWWLAYIGSLLLMFMGYALLGMGKNSSVAQPAAALPMLLVSLACNLIAMVVLICTCVKRYHDRDKSGWWFWLGLIPIIGGLWQLIELGFCSGDDAPNRFGPPPGSAARRVDLENEIVGLAGGGAMSKLDDNYMADYARKIAVQRAEAQARDGANTTGPSFGNAGGAPVFGKR